MKNQCVLAILLSLMFCFTGCGMQIEDIYDENPSEIPELVTEYYAGLGITKDIQKKNKNHYKLEEISFVLVPEDNDTVLMNFLYGNKVVRSTRFTDADLFNDRNAPFKEFIKWCEEDYKG